MSKSEYQYRLVTTKNGNVPITEIKEGTEVLSMGEWKISPKPVKGKAIRCTFDLLPTTTFEKQFTDYKREVSICHSIKLNPTKEPMPELSIRGYFKEDKKTSMTTFKGWEDLGYWLPKFIKLYDCPLMPYPTAIGFNIDHYVKKFTELIDEELTERNLEYILEGMLRKSFCYANGKYQILPSSSWSETHKIVLRLLDIECENFQTNRTVVRNPISLYRHIKDDYNKSRIKDEDIVYNLKKSTSLPLYTNGYKIIKKEEVEDWILPGINPDINTISPINCYEEGFTRNKWTCADPKKDGRKINLVKDNLYLNILMEDLL